MSGPYPLIDHTDYTRPLNNWTANTVREWLAVPASIYQYMYRRMGSRMTEARISGEILRTHVQRGRRTEVETAFAEEFREELKELAVVRRSLAIHGLTTVVNHNARRRIIRRDALTAKKWMDRLKAGKEKKADNKRRRINLQLEIKRGQPPSPQPITLRVVPYQQPKGIASGQQYTAASADTGTEVDADGYINTEMKANADAEVDADVDSNVNLDAFVGATSSLLVNDDGFDESGLLPQLPPTRTSDDFVWDCNIDYESDMDLNFDLLDENGQVL
ncbi:hypothetical protein MMC30_007166 [Trapelia coarctata]|nr:hypothetical protein [Trapelia coarctata]